MTVWSAIELQKVFHCLFLEEVFFLESIVKSVKTSPCVILNIGAGAGTSGLTFSESRRDIILHTVDIRKESHPLGCLSAELDVMSRAGFSHMLNRTWFQHHMPSQELSKIWGEKTDFLTIDILFIDGEHTYRGCKADIEGFFPYVRKGGFILVHDYNKLFLGHPKDLPGVTRAVNETLPDIADYYDTVVSTVAYKK
jgi:predicted O-methyltransferase YrrM